MNNSCTCDSEFQTGMTAQCSYCKEKAMGSKCVHRLLCWKADYDEATPRTVVYECNACKKEFIIEIEDETYWDVQNLV